MMHISKVLKKQCWNNKPMNLFLSNMPSLLKFKSIINLEQILVILICLFVESLNIFNKALQQEGIHFWYIFCIKHY